MSEVTPFRSLRRPRREIDDVLMEWGGYVRTTKSAQGVLHRLPTEEAEPPRIRTPGCHANPVLANLIAEERLGHGAIASLDVKLDSYPKLHRQMLGVLYVQGLSLATAAAQVELSERDAKGALALIRREVQIDWGHILLMQRRAA